MDAALCQRAGTDIDSLNGISTIDPIIELKVLALFAAPTHIRLQHYPQAAYDHIMSIDVCEVCLAPPLKCTGQLCSTFDEEREVLLCRSCKPAPRGEPKTIKSVAVEKAVQLYAPAPTASFDY